MSDDIQTQRDIARNWREYLSSIRESYGVYKWVWQELMSPMARKWSTYLVIVLSLITAIQMGSYWFLSLVFDGLVESNMRKVATGLAATLLIGMLLRRLLQVIRVHCREKVFGYNMAFRQHKISELFFEKSVGQHSRHHELLSAPSMEKGINKLSESQEIILIQSIEIFMGFTLSITLLWILSPTIGLLMTVAMCLHLAWSLYLNRIMIEVCTPLDAKFRAHARYMRERWREITRVKVNANTRKELTHMWDWFQDILSIDYPFWVRYGSHGVARGGLMDVFVFLSLAFGAYSVWQGHWAIGVLYPIFMWSENVKNYLWQIGEVEHRLNWNLPSIASLKRALTMKPDIVDKDDAVELSKDGPLTLEFAHVSFAYDDGMEVLRDISFTVHPGEKVALIGLSGCGKSTLTKLAKRYMDPSSGAIRVNGTALTDLVLDSWMRRLGDIRQKADVLDGTLKYNLLYGVDDETAVPVETIHEIMDHVQIDFARDGLETRVGEGGIKLSGGQQQRLMIAAAAMKRPTVVFMDEPTSSLDAVTEEKVHGGVQNILTDAMSALIITHRLATVRDICDRFIVLRPVHTLQEGESQIEAEAGSFEELYACSETFRQLADAQDIVCA